MQRVYTFAALREARTKLQNRRGNYITANLYAQRISRELLRAIMQCSFHHISHLTDATSGDARPRFVIGARQGGRQVQTDRHALTDTFIQTSDLGWRVSKFWHLTAISTAVAQFQNNSICSICCECSCSRGETGVCCQPQFQVSGIRAYVRLIQI